ncbi:amino acid ABC transporter permease [Marinomonas algicola]|uniref:amino acid ABC transporter permease n=1 Tax=Marinomonas algicola TaxID=2773454 RepID=UPI00174E5DB0|nr:amino acid ABC transporter permease [Marinomonas algicola]
MQINSDRSVLLAPPSKRVVKFLHQRAFRSKTDSIISIGFIITLSIVIYSLVNWAFIGAVWSADDVELCRTSSGACWSVIDARYRLILFGLYPYELHWRPILACIAIVVTVLLSCLPMMWSGKRLTLTWLVGFSSFYLLMEGRLLGLQEVSTGEWGGLALTLFLFSSVVLIGMPMGLGLALARRSTLPIIRHGVSLFIDTIRSLPLLTTLFVAAVVMPIVLPDWMVGDKIWRVIIAFSLFFACYQAEVFKGGFQGVSKGQFEAGDALGLSYFQVLHKIVLPQVFRNSLPGSINMVVITFKETAIVIIIGFFDVLASAHAAFGNGLWAPYYLEVYVFVALIYWSFIFSLSQYGAYLKRRMSIASH